MLHLETLSHQPKINSTFPRTFFLVCCLTFGPRAEPEDVVGVRPSLPVPALDDDLVLGGRGEAVEHKVAGVREGVVEVLEVCQNLCLS